MVSLLQILLLAHHVSGTNMPIIRSSRVLYRWLLPVVFGAVKMEDWNFDTFASVTLWRDLCHSYICNFVTGPLSLSFHSFVEGRLSLCFSSFVKGLCQTASVALWRDLRHSWFNDPAKDSVTLKGDSKCSFLTSWHKALHQPLFHQWLCRFFSLSVLSSVFRLFLWLLYNHPLAHLNSVPHCWWR
jgi:hypothetical protein